MHLEGSFVEALETSLVLSTPQSLQVCGLYAPSAASVSSHPKVTVARIPLAPQENTKVSPSVARRFGLRLVLWVTF